MNFPLENTMFELNSIARNMACCRVTCVCFPHWIAIAIWATRPKRDDVFRRVKLLRALYHVVRMILIRGFLLSSGMLRVRLLVLIMIPNWALR